MYKIERMDIGDYDKIHELWTNTEGLRLTGADDSKERIERFLKRNPETNFTAKTGAEIIGTVMAGHDGRRGHIYHLAVKDGFRNKGIGRKLVERVEIALRQEGITKTFLAAFTDNEAGNGFWDKVGYKTRRDINYRDKVIAV